MRLFLPLLLLGLGVTTLTAHPAAVRADGVVSISWDRPAGPGQPAITWRSFDGPGPVDVYVTVTGVSSPIQGWYVYVEISTATCPAYRDPLPDAWRFDEAGCQAGRVCFVGQGFSELLPQPMPPGFLWIDDIRHNEGGRETEVILAELYPQVMHPDPAQTYTLLRLRFDHGLSVAGPGTDSSCGGAEEETYLRISEASYVEAQGMYESQWARGNEVIGWKGKGSAPGNVVQCTDLAESPPALLAAIGQNLQSTMPVCDFPVPAGATSWGRLKSAYR